MRRLVMGMLAALLLASAAGCGDDAPDGPSAQPLTKTEYERRFKEVLAASSAANRANAGKGEAAQATAVISGFELTLSDLGALRPPDAARQAHADYLASVREQFEQRRPAFEAIAAGDKVRARRLARGDVPPATLEKARSARRFFQSNGYDLNLEPLDP